MSEPENTIWRDGCRSALGPSACVFVLALAGCLADTPETRPEAASSSLAEPVLVGPGLISTGLSERDATMTPDGTEFYFTVWTGSSGVIAVSRRANASWSQPEVASFSGRFNDLEPSITPDGARLYFASTRPGSGDSTSVDYDIWYVEREGATWGQASPADSVVNTPGNEYFPSLTSEGELYFTAKREGGAGGEDIWRAIPTESGLRVEPVPGGVNTDRDEFNAFVAPDGSYLIFSSWGRADGLGGGDLYVSFRDTQGVFSPSINMGPGINSPGLDYSPFVSPDRKEFYFSSRRPTYKRSSERWSYRRLRGALSAPGNGAGDIFRVSASVLDSLRAASGG